MKIKIKKIIASILTFMMIFTQVPVNVFANNQNNSIPLDIVLALDVSGSMNDPLSGGTKRMSVLKDSVYQLIDEFSTKNTNIEDVSKQNRIAIVKFAGDKNNNVGNDTYYSGGYKYNNTQVVSDYVAVKATNAEALKEKVKAINTYLCDTVEYPAQEPYSDVSHTAYGSFVEHSAVCDGYARAADILCEEAGVNCQIVIGEVRNGGGHAWNLVQLDGQWYQWDVCWNDGGSSRREYFLVTDAFMEKSRTWDKTEFPKSATHSYSYN